MSSSTQSNDEINDILVEIYAWLEQIPFSRPRRNISRDFSNGVFMAELLKQYYPKYVDLHNYSPSNSLANKMENWYTLNRKVFSKLDMMLTDEIIYQIASSQPKTIEFVLMKLRSKILKDCNDDRKSLYTANGMNDEKPGCKFDSVLDVNEIQSEMIPRTAYTKLKKELDEKNDAIVVLTDKIHYLESLIQLKDQRITDLATQLTRLDKS